MAVSQTAKALWARFMTDTKSFGRVLDKVRIVSANDGRCTAELTVAEEHSNSHGTLHGGLSATIVDIVSTLALVTHKRQAFGVSTDLHVSYLKAAEIGEDVVIEANTIRAGRTLAYLEVYIKKKSDGSVVAKGSHTKFIGNESGNLFENLSS
ncbi:acyl-coenzyme A thioesterase 13-like [Macrosteles quadrilineatus]|uniref:acyl-coenzyme A thioesterase 13-like n=1 Tax=Macrosteles quadrilineatus TaxID=74068 RepID=UPI0023E2B3F2|nr:acyl-coenzyme A thioesterase 13-like [Macrosteles quadrilineatus]